MTPLTSYQDKIYDTLMSAIGISVRACVSFGVRFAEWPSGDPRMQVRIPNNLKYFSHQSLCKFFNQLRLVLVTVAQLEALELLPRSPAFQDLDEFGEVRRMHRAARQGRATARKMHSDAP